MNITILPAGSWGTALALHLTRQGHAVSLVPRSLEDALSMAGQREHRRHLPGVRLPAELQIGLELGPSLMEAELLILACPSRHLREVARRVREALPPAGSAGGLKMVLALCKGLEHETHLLPNAVLAEELPGLAAGVLSGPSFASQVAAGKPTAVVLAAKGSVPLLDAIQAALSGDTFRVYTSRDITGVELGGCLKNIYAIAAGMCDGMNLGDNSKAALVTRALHEMVRLGTALGGRMETFYGLSGLGDLILTCNGQESRNRRFGEDLARHGLAETRRIHGGETVEGARAAECFHAVCAARHLEAPILDVVYQSLRGDCSVQDALCSLMGRRLKSERA